jgi:hypothetical protein
LVVGLPRSGSTWLATMLGKAGGSTLVSEPDNHLMIPAALRAKRRLGRGIFPYLVPDESALEYEEIWAQAFGESGADYTFSEMLRRTAAHGALAMLPEQRIRQAFRVSPSVTPGIRLVERLAVPDRPASLTDDLIVKSVYAPLAVEWIAARFEANVVVLLRDVRNVASSWIELGWTGSLADDELAMSHRPTLERLGREWGLPQLPADQPVSRLAWFLGLLTVSLEQAAARHPEWTVVRHEAVCADPRRSFKELAARLGLEWTDEADAAVGDTNRAGRGFQIQRVAAELPHAWRSRLASEQIDEIESVLAPFPLTGTA